MSVPPGPPAQPAGEFRPAHRWQGIRTACHGCRTAFAQREIDEHGAQNDSQVLVAGDGTVTRLAATDSEDGQIFVTEPCPICGESETPGWLSGFVPPV